MSIEAMKLALEALENVPWGNLQVQAMTALHQSIAEAETLQGATIVTTGVGIGKRAEEAYEAAKKHGWVGLSDERLMEQAQPVACGACNGSGWIVRDPDIGTDQECFVCDSKGSNIEQSTEQIQPSAYSNTHQQSTEQETVAWLYEQAKFGSTDLRGQQWRLELSRLKPYAGNGLVRNIQPLYTSPPQRQPLTDEMVVAAARVLNDIQADACGVDRDDQWTIYSDGYKADALAMLKAAHGIKGEA